MNRALGVGLVGYVTFPCPQNEQKRSIHRLDDSIVRESRSRRPHWMERPLACEAKEQADPPDITITASEPPKPSLHSPMTISGRITASAA